MTTKTKKSIFLILLMASMMPASALVYEHGPDMLDNVANHAFRR